MEAPGSSLRWGARLQPSCAPPQCPNLTRLGHFEPKKIAGGDPGSSAFCCCWWEVREVLRSHRIWSGFEPSKPLPGQCHLHH